MSTTRSARVTVVTAPGHSCRDAQAALADLAKYFPLTVRTVTAASPAWQALARRHRTGLFPVVLLDGGFFSAGRLPRRKLAHRLAARAAALGHRAPEPRAGRQRWPQADPVAKTAEIGRARAGKDGRPYARRAGRRPHLPTTVFLPAT